MPYISIKDLRTIDNYLTKQCSKNPVQNMSKKEADQEIKEYCEVVVIFRKLYEGQEKLNAASKKCMKKHRAKDPEKAKAYNHNYYIAHKKSK